MYRNLYLVLFALLTTALLKAQDSHYWTQQFGTRSALLGVPFWEGLKTTP